MAEYRPNHPDIVIRTADAANIPNAAGNINRIEYEAWHAAGGVPDGLSVGTG